MNHSPSSLLILVYLPWGNLSPELIILFTIITIFFFFSLLLNIKLIPFSSSYSLDTGGREYVKFIIPIGVGSVN